MGNLVDDLTARHPGESRDDEGFCEVLRASKSRDHQNPIDEQNGNIYGIQDRIAPWIGFESPTRALHLSVPVSTSLRMVAKTGTDKILHPFGLFSKLAEAKIAFARCRCV